MLMVNLVRHKWAFGAVVNASGTTAKPKSESLRAIAPLPSIGLAVLARSEVTSVQLALLLGLVLFLVAVIFTLHWRAYVQIRRRVHALSESMRRSMPSGSTDSLIIPLSNSSIVPGFLQWLIEPASVIGDVERAATSLADGLLESKGRMREREARNILWLSLLCHDLCAPLVRIRSRIEALRSSVHTSIADQRQAMESACIEIGQMRELIASISDFAQTDRDADRTFEPTDLRQILEYALTVFEFDAGRRNIELDLRVLPDVGEVRMHRVLIRRALENLISNALRFTPDGGLICLRAERCGKVVNIRVSDTGPGIPPEQMRHIFDYRFRADTKDTSRPASSGLGLSLVHKVAYLHDGEVSVRNLEPSGAEFTISLPLAGLSPSSR